MVRVGIYLQTLPSNSRLGFIQQPHPKGPVTRTQSLVGAVSNWLRGVTASPKDSNGWLPAPTGFPAEPGDAVIFDPRTIPFRTATSPTRGTPSSWRTGSKQHFFSHYNYYRNVRWNWAAAVLIPIFAQLLRDHDLYPRTNAPYADHVDGAGYPLLWSEPLQPGRDTRRSAENVSGYECHVNYSAG